MNLGRASTKELRQELDRRKDVERQKQEAEFVAWAEQNPCPYCQTLPNEKGFDMTEEHRMAPRDHDGRPMLYMPYEMGMTVGATYEFYAACPNGHRWIVDMQTKMFEKPIEGPPIMPRR